MPRDWIAWHEAYNDPLSSLSQRRRVVVGFLRAAFDAALAGPIRVLSLCSGDAMDMVTAARDHPRRGDVRGVFVELDADLAERGQGNLHAAGIEAEMRCADAGDTSVYAESLPVDVLLLVGIFGNITNEDVFATIGAVPALCGRGASVLWTRHRREPDLTPSIRAWFDDVSCSPAWFDSPGSGKFAVGHERFDFAQPGSPASPASPGSPASPASPPSPASPASPRSLGSLGSPRTPSPRQLPATLFRFTNDLW